MKTPGKDDWANLSHMVEYMKETETMLLILSSDESDNLYWYADSAFAAHKDMKSHTGAGLTIRTHAELVGMSDILPMVQWVQLFLLSQGVSIAGTIIYQDNKLAVLLEDNGKKSSSKRTRHLNIRYFLVMDAIAKGECEMVWIS